MDWLSTTKPVIEDTTKAKSITMRIRQDHKAKLKAEAARLNISLSQLLINPALEKIK